MLVRTPTRARFRFRSHERTVVRGEQLWVLEEPESLLQRFWALGPGFDRGAPNPRDATEFLFLGGQSATDSRAVNIPKNVSMAFLIAIGGGGSGACGFAAAGTAGGGGGGGSGATGGLTIPARLLPSTIFCSPGLGGAAVNASGANGTLGGPSAIADLTSGGGTILSAPTASAVATGGTSAASGSGGTGGTNTQVRTFYTMGDLLAATGNNGTNGGGTAPTAGVNLTPVQQITGGTGGGGKTAGAQTAGGDISASNYWQQKIAGGAAGSGNGTDGDYLGAHPFMMRGGSGGGSSSAGTGGNGGNGSYGCGGGGSGAGATQGKSGAGGPGLIYLCFW